MAPKDALPISQSTISHGNNPSEPLKGLRRRLSSFSVNMQPLSSATTEWALRKSKSVPSFRDLTPGPLKKWWLIGWNWIVSKKKELAHDLEMHGEGEKDTMLGGNGVNGFMHMFYKVRSEIRKLVGSDGKLPTTHKFRYDSFNYAKNFDEGGKTHL
ncbi:hypothetical protein LUZ60_003384 [Juncus effusus]|nr:hypothetical protein LUZ60_003384 [Juncus effusus]